jgi:predicted nucleic acid-binding protein
VTKRTSYVDASALVKLALEEPETLALRAHLSGEVKMSTSEVAVIEVTRAARVGGPGSPALAEARRVLAESTLVAVTRAIVDRAAELASSRLRTLDAIHLATALAVEPDEVVAYDRRLLAAAELHGLAVASPGAER